MKTMLVPASLLLAASSPVVIVSQFVQLDAAARGLVFVSGYVAVGLLAIAVSDYSRKARRPARPTRDAVATPAPATPPPPLPATATWSYHPFSA